MDVRGVIGHYRNCGRGIGGHWMYGLRCGRELLRFAMVEGFRFSQVGIL